MTQTRRGKWQKRLINSPTWCFGQLLLYNWCRRNCGSWRLQRYMYSYITSWTGCIGWSPAGGMVLRILQTGIFSRGSFLRVFSVTNLQENHSVKHFLSILSTIKWLQAAILYKTCQELITPVGWQSSSGNEERSLVIYPAVRASISCSAISCMTFWHLGLQSRCQLLQVNLPATSTVNLTYFLISLRTFSACSFTHCFWLLLFHTYSESDQWADINGWKHSNLIHAGSVLTTERRSR